ncbi:MAG: CoA transferase [Gemmatimonadaceae bacterium]
MTNLPLDGVKVVDLSRVLAGPLCTMMLADLGADIIKVERPGRGDDTRGWGPPFDASGESAYYLSTNRNKFSVTADLNAATDRALIASLIDEADVVVENFRPGALSRAGLSADDCLQRNGRLIWCTITGFGPRSPRPGYDAVVQAESGWMAITGEPDGAPMKSGVAVTDLIAGRDAAIAILAALVGRDSQRGARRLFISLVDSARSALVNVAQNSLLTGEEARRWGNAHANLVPYQLFRASDRELVIACGSDEQWRACARVLGLDALAGDDALTTNAGRLAHRARVVTAMQQVLGGRTAAEWMRDLAGADVPCGLVKTVREALTEAAGASPVSGMPSSVGGALRRPPPRLNEHGEAVRRHGWAAFSSPEHA